MAINKDLQNLEIPSEPSPPPEKRKGKNEKRKSFSEDNIIVASPASAADKAYNTELDRNESEQLLSMAMKQSSMKTNEEGDIDLSDS